MKDIAQYVCALVLVAVCGSWFYACGYVAGKRANCTKMVITQTKGR